MSETKAARISASLLRWSFGVFLFLIGADKVSHTNLVAEWERFVGPLALAVFPFPPQGIVLAQGCIELALAILILFTPYVRLATALFIASILAVIVDLLFLGNIILILRDLLVIVAGAVLMLLHPRRQEAVNP